MLLSLLSRRTLEADSRDSYGFAVRPQHLHRYRQYGNIYKEEEDERSEKWRNFLAQFSEPVVPCSPVVEHLETSQAKDVSENLVSISDEHLGQVSDGKKPTSDGDKEGGIKEIKPREIKAWGPIRPSLDPIEKMMSVRVKSGLCMSNVRVQEHLPVINEEMLEEKVYVDNLENWVPNDHSASEERDEEPEKSEDIVENKCAINNAKVSGEYFDISDQTEDIQAKSYQIVDSRHKEEDINNENIAINNKPYLPWKEELESLVHGGVPKSPRGEVWQAFVGVQTRRVESYYQNLLSVDDASDGKNHPAGVPIDNSTLSEPEKWKKQIEKVIRCMGLGLMSLNLSS